MHYRIEDEFDCTAARYWQVFFDEAYNTALFAHLDIAFDLLKLERDASGQVTRREQRLTPNREVPALMAKFVKDAISYTESNVFHAERNLLDVVTTPSFMADKVKTHGTYFLEPIGEGRVRRVWDGVAQVSVPLVGSKMEQLLVDQVRDSYAKTTVFTRRWLAEHPA